MYLTLPAQTFLSLNILSYIAKYLFWEFPTYFHKIIIYKSRSWNCSKQSQHPSDTPPPPPAQNFVSLNIFSFIAKIFVLGIFHLHTEKHNLYIQIQKLYKSNHIIHLTLSPPQTFLSLNSFAFIDKILVLSIFLLISRKSQFLYPDPETAQSTHIIHLTILRSWQRSTLWEYLQCKYSKVIRVQWSSSRVVIGREFEKGFQSSVKQPVHIRRPQEQNN